MKLYTRFYFYALMICVFFTTQPAFAGAGKGIDRENGPLENLQVAFLCIGAALLLSASFKSVRLVRCVMLVGGWLCISFIFRELDVEDLNVPQWVIAVGSGTGRNLIMAVGWIGITVYAVRVRAEINKPLLLQVLRSRTFILLCSSAFLMVISALFEERVFDIAKSQLYEEFIEAVGYALFVTALLPANLRKAVELTSG